MHIFNKHDMTQRDLRAGQPLPPPPTHQPRPPPSSPLDKLDAMLTGADTPCSTRRAAQAAQPAAIAENGFAKLGLDAAILRALSELNYITPTPVQAQAIPLLPGRP